MKGLAVSPQLNSLPQGEEDAKRHVRVDDGFHVGSNRAASLISPRFISGRQRNLCKSGFALPSTASAVISPKNRAHFNSCPQSPVEITKIQHVRSAPIQKSSYFLLQKMQTSRQPQPPSTR